MSTVPDAGGGSVSRGVVAEVLGLPAQGTLDADRQVSVAAVEDLGEQVGWERGELWLHPLLC